MPAKKKCSQYSVEYLKFGFIPSPDNEQLPLCLMCEKTLSNESMKPSRLLEHLNKKHKDRKDKDENYFISLKNDFKRRKPIASFFASKQNKICNGLICSYNISKLIAKSGKPHAIGEQLILPAVEEVLRTVVQHSSTSSIIKSIPLSNDSVKRRIDEMGEDVERTVCMKLRSKSFSLQLDESTLPGNESLLLSYVRYIDEGKLIEEFLFAKELKTDTKGESIFNVVADYFNEKEIPLKNLVACATDGAPALTGRHKGFLALLKKEVPTILTVHCVIHRQHLVARKLSDRLHQSLGIVISCVNKIKAHALNSRLFRELCISNDEDYDPLLLHTEVRWLSRGRCLKRFNELFTSVIQFCDENGCDSLSKELKKRKSDIAYLTDLFSIFNELNLRLQGTEMNLIKVKSIVSSFLDRLTLLRQNIGRRDLSQFPSLRKLENECNSITDDELSVYCKHLLSLRDYWRSRFEDIIDLEIPY